MLIPQPQFPMSRVRSIDSMKAIAAFAVVAIHCTPCDPLPGLSWQITNQLARFAVPFFFIMAGYFFTVTHRRGEPLRRLLPRYALRIGGVFLAWSLFYGFLVPVCRGVMPFSVACHGLLNWIRYPHAFLMLGGFFHLWFLSSLVQGLVILSFFLWIRAPRLAVVCGAALYLFGLVTGSYAPTPMGIHIRFNTLCGPFLSTFFVSVGSLLAITQFKTTTRVALAILLAGVAMHLGEGAFLYGRFGVPIATHSYLFGTIPFGIGAALLALSKPDLGESLNLAAIGRYSLGIYVLHPFLIQFILRQPRLSWLIRQPAPLCVIACIITTASVLALARWRRLGWLVS